MARKRKVRAPEEGKLIRKQFTASEIKAMDDEDEDKRVLEFTISTDTVDRMGDVVSPDGWDLEPYKKNPVVLFAHDSSKPPIGKALDVWLDNNKLKAKAQFMDNDIDPSGFSDTIYRMVKNGFLKATSVGFLPKKWDFITEACEDEDDDQKITGIKFIEQELLEFSVVPVPANPDALMAAKNAGIDLQPLDCWFEEALDRWADYKDCLLLPKKAVEDMYKTVHKAQTKVFDFSKHFDKRPKAEKMVISYQSAHPEGTPKAPEDTEWNGNEAVRDAEVDDLLVMCAWREDKARDELVKSDFKLPHHQPDSDHTLIWRGVAAAMGALMGARGGVDIPDDERRGVYDHLAQHYREFDKEPPEFEAVEAQILKNDEYEFDLGLGLPKRASGTEGLALGDSAKDSDDTDAEFVLCGEDPYFSASYELGDLRLEISIPDKQTFVELHREHMSKLLDLAADHSKTNRLDEKEVTSNVQSKSVKGSSGSEDVASDQKDSTQMKSGSDSSEGAIDKEEEMQEIVGMLPQIIREVLDSEMKAIQGKVA